MSTVRHSGGVWIIGLFAACVWCICCSMRVARAQAVQHPAAKADEQPQQAVFVAEEDIDPKQPLGTSFVINVSVLHEPEPSGNYAINGAGNILLHVAEVLTPAAVRGLTCTEAAAKITTYLKNYIRNPEVTVTIVSVPKSVVNVSGAVHRGGPTVIMRRTTLADLLSGAEWTEAADLSQVRIIRQNTNTGASPSSVQVYHLDRYVQPRLWAKLPMQRRTHFYRIRM